MASPSRSTPDGHGTERIRDPRRIAAILQSAADQHAAVSLRIDGEELPSPSMILALDADAGWIELDEPVDSSPCRRDIELQVRLRVGGIPAAFATTTLDDDWTVAWPDSIRFGQRREAYRAPVARTLHARIEIGDYVGRIRDLSVDGVCFELPERLEPRIGETVSDCVLSVGDEPSLVADLEIRRVSWPDDHSTLIGARFLQPRPDLARRLRQWVMSLERDARRRASASDRP